MRFRSQLQLLGLALGLSAFAVTSAVAQGNGTVAGRVTQEANGAAIGGARVSVLGTNLTAITNSEGRYTITNVGAGTHDVRVAALGYGSLVKTVSVTTGGVAQADFAVKMAAISLDEIVVTATGETRAREQGTSIATIDAAKMIAEKPIANVSDLLNSRAAGVQVLPAAGEVGTGERIRIRGQSSINLSNDPIIYIDGIRAESSTNSGTLGVGGQTFSRLNDLNPDDIASIEIAKGPAAGTLYGTQAANGVIRITTKRGIAGPPRWNVFTEFGASRDRNTYPTNYFAWSGASHCQLLNVAAGSCTIDSVTSFNPLANSVTTPLNTGYRENVGAQVSGGSEQAQYYLSGEYANNVGVYKMPAAEVSRLIDQTGITPTSDQIRPNQFRAVNLRSNVRATLSSATRVSFDAGFVRDHATLPQNDNNVLGMLPSAYFGKGITTEPSVQPAGAVDGQQWGFFRPGEVFQFTTAQDVSRFTGSGHLDWKPLDFLTGQATVGLDYTSRRTVNFQAYGTGPDFATRRQGHRNDDRDEISHYTVDGNLTATRRLSSRITSETIVGAQYLKDYVFGNRAGGDILAPGSQNLGSAAQPNVNEVTTTTVTIGAYAQEKLGLNDRLYLTGGIRTDRNSAFGSQSRTTVYPKAEASWVVSEEPFFPRLPVSSVRLRFAYGATGRQPGSTDALLYLGANTASITGTDVPGLIISSLGNPDLKPERTTGYETGIEVGFADNAADLKFTYYHNHTINELVNVPLAPSIGATQNRFENLGEVQNHGLELELNVTTDPSRAISGSFDLAASRNTNKLVTLGAGIPTIVNGLTRDTVGFPLNGYWDYPITSYADANGNGIIEASEVTVDSVARYLGSSIPLNEVTGNFALNVFHNRVQLSTQLDYRGDFSVRNLTDYFRCTSGASGFNCAADNVVSTPAFEQARAVAGRSGADHFTNAGYVESGNFLKMRALSLVYTAPDSWSRAIFHANTLRIALTARNLFTVTNYSGVDPEVNGAASANNPDSAVLDFLTQPPVTSYLVRVSLGF
jgi:TonB-linked SusC/RagA family outer membrane protein